METLAAFFITLGLAAVQLDGGETPANRKDCPESTRPQEREVAERIGRIQVMNEWLRAQRRGPLERPHGDDHG